MKLYNIYLVSSGWNKINTIKAIRSVTTLGLKEAKDMADAANDSGSVLLMGHVSKEHVDNVAKIFSGVAALQTEEIIPEFTEPTEVVSEVDSDRLSELSFNEKLMLRNTMRLLLGKFNVTELKAEGCRHGAAVREGA